MEARQALPEWHAIAATLRPLAQIRPPAPGQRRHVKAKFHQNVSTKNFD